MWRRAWDRSSYVQQPQFQISQPVLFDTSMDERYLETIPEVESILTRTSRASSVGVLPDLPFKVVAPLQTDRTPRYSRDSSIYSQATPYSMDHQHEYTIPQSSPGPGDVSPLSTPRSSLDLKSGEDQLVSPIEPERTLSSRLPIARMKLQIHVPNPESQEVHNMQMVQPVSRQKEETKWDAYSGEPTNDENGLPPSARPGAQLESLEVQYPQLKERTRQILANLRERDASKRILMQQTPSPTQVEPLDNPVKKVPWKGASGRTTLVDPVANNPAARQGPLQPKRDVIKIEVTEILPATQPEDDGLDEYTPIPRRSSKRKSPLTIRTVTSYDSIKPVVPLKLGALSPRNRSPESPMSMLESRELQSPFHTPSPAVATIVEHPPTPPLESTAVEAMAYPSSPPRTASSTPTRNEQRSEGNPQNLSTMHLKHEPESRLSWTTYATTVTDSPKSTEFSRFDNSSAASLPPMPPMPLPIMVKKRPVSSNFVPALYSNSEAASSNITIFRKPVSNERARTTSLTTMASLTKSLPQCPPELEAADKLASLKARMDDIARRKHNLGKIIKNHKDSLRKNSIIYNINQIKEMEKRIAHLNDELNDVKAEEHEIGILLHRVQRKKDREDNYEQPTGLWIRRITSSTY